MNLIDGARLRRARKEKGYTQKHLSLLSGVSQNHISMAENGSANLSIKRLRNIAILLDVDVRDLVLSSVDELQDNLNVSDFGVLECEEIAQSANIALLNIQKITQTFSKFSSEKEINKATCSDASPCQM